VIPGKRMTRSICSILSALTLSAMAVTAVLAIPAQASDGQSTVAATCGASPEPSQSTGSGSAAASPTATASATDDAGASSTATGVDSGDPTASQSPTATAPASTSPSASPTVTATVPACPTTAAPSPSRSLSARPSATGLPGRPSQVGGSAVARSTTPTPPPAAVTTTASPTALAPVNQYAYAEVPPGDSSVQLPHGTITRAEIILRAQQWLTEQVPYSEDAWWTDSDGVYRQDCSGYVSMAWALDPDIDFWTGNLDTVSYTIPAAQLEPGDILLSDSHTILFAGWADAAHTTFDFYEESHPGTVAHFVVDAPLADYLDNGFAAFRYDGVAGATGGALPANPAQGVSYAALIAGGSELVPTGASIAEPPAAPWQTGTDPLLAWESRPAEPSTAAATHVPPVSTVAEVQPETQMPTVLLASAAGLAFLLAGAVAARRPRRTMPARYTRRH
jgi:hypothetical protein